MWVGLRRAHKCQALSFPLRSKYFIDFENLILWASRSEKKLFENIMGYPQIQKSTELHRIEYVLFHPVKATIVKKKKYLKLATSKTTILF